MSDQLERAGTVTVGQGEDVVSDAIELVGADALRLAAEVLAALVGSDAVQACLGERIDLVTPVEPELREAVQQDGE